MLEWSTRTGRICVMRGLADFRGARVLGDRRRRRAADHRLRVARGVSVLAIDPDEDSIGEARRTLAAEQRDKVTFRVASVAELEVTKAEFDLVLFSWSL